MAVAPFSVCERVLKLVDALHLDDTQRFDLFKTYTNAGALVRKALNGYEHISASDTMRVLVQISTALLDHRARISVIKLIKAFVQGFDGERTTATFAPLLNVADTFPDAVLQWLSEDGDTASPSLPDAFRQLLGACDVANLDFRAALSAARTHPRMPNRLDDYMRSGRFLLGALARGLPLSASTSPELLFHLVQWRGARNQPA
jgi:hypothetical protein